MTLLCNNGKKVRAIRIGLALFVFLLLGIQTKAQSYSGPESVEYDYANSRWLISNTSTHQVLARDSNGVLTIFTTLTGTGPYGIEIAGDTLFCCNGSSVKGFLLSNAQQVFNINTPATFLNGITHDNSGHLIVTDFSGKGIYKINIDSVTVTPMATSMNTTPNGIIFDAANNRCVYVNWGTNAPIKAIDMTTNIISTLTTTTLGSCDGIARDGNGNYYVTAWSLQSVVKYDSAFSASPVTVVNGLNNPADIFYNTVSDTLAIPNAGNSTVLFIGFSTVGISNQPNTFPAFILNNSEIRFTNPGPYSTYAIYDMRGRLHLSGSVKQNEVVSLDGMLKEIYLLVLEGQNCTLINKLPIVK